MKREPNLLLVFMVIVGAVFAAMLSLSIVNEVAGTTDDVSALYGLGTVIVGLAGVVLGGIGWTRRRRRRRYSRLP